MPQTMMTVSNLLSIARAPLALFFLQENVMLRTVAITLAMITDSIDGYFARKNSSTSKFGAILDPAMDKFFVYFVLSVLFFEDKIKLWQALTFISRDFALLLFALYLLLSKRWRGYKLRAIRWGKITTAMQFLILIGITVSFSFPTATYGLFILFAILAFFELCVNLQ